MELYVHIPFCMRKCAYCDFLSGEYDAETRKAYTDALCTEIKLCASILRDRRIETIYIGGGTPSWLELPLLSQIMDTVNSEFIIDPKAEVTIEVNPGTAAAEHFHTYKSLGINRISIGLQSANDDELRLLGRVHDFNRFLHTFEFARNEGFSDINVDIMTGLPFQTPATLTDTIRRVARLVPSHISAYALMIEEGTPFYDRYKFDAVKQHAGMPTEELPNEDEEYELSKCAQRELEGVGYKRYEISNYARDGYECRHNLGYWRRVPYLGVGLGAASLIGEERFSDLRDIYAYIDAAKKVSDIYYSGDERDIAATPFVAGRQTLSRREQMDEFFYLGLRQTKGVWRRDFVEMFGMDPEPIYGEAIERLKDEELLKTKEGRFWLTEKGLDLSNYALAQFLP